MSIRSIQRGLAGLDIRLVRLDEFRPFIDFPKRVEGKVDRYTDVSRHEPVAVERVKGVEAAEKKDDGEEAEGKIGRVWLKGRSENEGAAIDALSFERGVKPDVGNGNAHPGEKSGDCDDSLKPLKDFFCAG